MSSKLTQEEINRFVSEMDWLVDSGFNDKTHIKPKVEGVAAIAGHDLVQTFRHGLVFVDVELNKAAHPFDTIVYEACPSCGLIVEQDLVAFGGDVEVISYACGCTVTYEKDKEPVYVKGGK